MIRALVAPRRYVQGPGALAEAGKLVSRIGTHALVLWGPNAKAAAGGDLVASLGAAGVEAVPFLFSGESSRGQVRLGVDAARAARATVVVAAGGGKAMDTGRAVAFGIGVPFVAVPTIASNDSPTSACTVYYTDDGVLDGWDVWPANPDLVLVDTGVIAGAPVRWLVSGMGDALATWFEAEAAARADRVAFSGGVPTAAALALARLCHDTLMEHGLAARADVERHRTTPAVEAVVEANVLLSGIGWESGGLATAHTVGNGITILPGTHPYSHGEKVAFGLLVQMCLDPAVPAPLRDRVLDFMVAVGLPVTLDGIGVGGADEAEFRRVADALTGPGQLIHNHAFPVNAPDLFSAITAADALGRSRLAR
jgi:glycerol dehydrogenase